MNDEICLGIGNELGKRLVQFAADNGKTTADVTRRALWAYIQEDERKQAMSSMDGYDEKSNEMSMEADRMDRKAESLPKHKAERYREAAMAMRNLAIALLRVKECEK